MPFLILKVRFFLMTLRKLTQRISRSLISFVLGFRVSHFQSPENEEVSKIQEVLSSSKLQKLLKKGSLNIFFLKMFPDCLVITKGKHSLQSCERWMNWGMVLNGKCLTADIMYPKTGSACSLSDILEDSVDDKYFLSQRAIDRLMSYKDTKIYPEL